MLGKQAKILTNQQIKTVLTHLSSGRNASRNRVMFLLSLHGLRAKEIANLEISMVTDSEAEVADAVALEDKASKGRSGRIIPMNPLLRNSLSQYLQERAGHNSKFVIVTERSDKFSANAIAVFFNRLYKTLGFSGCSSHSGRRTAITRCARKVMEVGGSLRDVMAISGHRHLSSVQLYIEQDPKAQEKLMKAIYGGIR